MHPSLACSDAEVCTHRTHDIGLSRSVLNECQFARECEHSRVKLVARKASDHRGNRMNLRRSGIAWPLSECSFTFWAVCGKDNLHQRRAGSTGGCALFEICAAFRCPKNASKSPPMCISSSCASLLHNLRPQTNEQSQGTRPGRG